MPGIPGFVPETHRIMFVGLVRACVIAADSNGDALKGHAALFTREARRRFDR